MVLIFFSQEAETERCCQTISQTLHEIYCCHGKPNVTAYQAMHSFQQLSGGSPGGGKNGGGGGKGGPIAAALPGIKGGIKQEPAIGSYAFKLC